MATSMRHYLSKQPILLQKVISNHPGKISEQHSKCNNDL